MTKMVDIYKKKLYKMGDFFISTFLCASQMIVWTKFIKSWEKKF